MKDALGQASPRREGCETESVPGVVTYVGLLSQVSRELSIFILLLPFDVVALSNCKFFHG